MFIVVNINDILDLIRQFERSEKGHPFRAGAPNNYLLAFEDNLLYGVSPIINATGTLFTELLKGPGQQIQVIFQIQTCGSRALCRIRGDNQVLAVVVHVEIVNLES